MGRRRYIPANVPASALHQCGRQSAVEGEQVPCRVSCARLVTTLREASLRPGRWPQGWPRHGLCWPLSGHLDAERGSSCRDRSTDESRVGKLWLIRGAGSRGSYRCDVLWRRFVDGYTRPFHEKYGDSAAGGGGDMLDLIEEGAFVATGGGRLQPGSKDAVFREFMAPLDLEEEIAARDAEVALAFLVEQGMVEVAGDEITVPASFWSRGRASRPPARRPGRNA